MPFRRQYTEGPARVVEWFAPAKINLFLRIVGKRPDGYHDLQSLMVPLSYGDELTVKLFVDDPQRQPHIDLKVRGQELPADPQNLAYRAAALFEEQLQKPLPAVALELQKNTFVGAGLGGGSSDAAAVLLSLNTLLAEPFSKKELATMAARLGADVPFFILEQVAMAQGTGTLLEPFTIAQPLWFLLVNPGFPVSTAWVYQNFRPEWASGLTNGSVNEIIKGLSDRRVENQKVGDFPWDVLLHNDLERLTLVKHPEIAAIKSRLQALGAKGALMSGSGPTVFGLFPGADGEQRANEALRQLENHEHWRAVPAHKLP